MPIPPSSSMVASWFTSLLRNWKFPLSVDLLINGPSNASSRTTSAWLTYKRWIALRPSEAPLVASVDLEIEGPKMARKKRSWCHIERGAAPELSSSGGYRQADPKWYFKLYDSGSRLRFCWTIGLYGTLSRVNCNKFWLHLPFANYKEIKQHSELSVQWAGLRFPFPRNSRAVAKIFNSLHVVFPRVFRFPRRVLIRTLLNSRRERITSDW